MAGSIGDKIKHLLYLRNMKQADLVRMTGISKATVSELINNKQKTTSLETIERIAKALRVSAFYFLEENSATPLEATSHLPENIQKFIINSENMDYLILAHKLKTKELPPDIVDKIIELYEEMMKKTK